MVARHSYLSPLREDSDPYYLNDPAEMFQLCCAFVGCWLTEPLNHYFGRRGTIFITGMFSFLTCIWQGGEYASLAEAPLKLNSLQ